MTPPDFLVERVPGRPATVRFEATLPPEMIQEMLALIIDLIDWEAEIDFFEIQTPETLKKALLSIGISEKDDIAVLCLYNQWPLLKEAFNAALNLPLR